MRKRLIGGVAALAFAVSTVSVGSAQAQTGPTNRCYGDISAGIAATWPWAHEGQIDFPPPPGALDLWLELFGPEVGISSVRELQLLFCSAP
jgi:hypothetical protein